MIVYDIPPVFAAEKFMEITSEDQLIDSITIEQNSKKDIICCNQRVETLSFQWQILLDPQESIWVNIYDKNRVGLQKYLMRSLKICSMIQTVPI